MASPRKLSPPRFSRTSELKSRLPTAPDFNDSPLLVFYEVTRACDLVCTHCRACAQPWSHPDELTTENSLRLIDQLAEFTTPPTLVLTGGDPLKRNDIFLLVKRASSAGLAVAITPSATPLVTADAIRRLCDAGVSRLAISIDGPTAAIHDTTRGVAGSFELSLRILSDAQSAGLSTQVNTTVAPANVEKLDQMAELLSKVQIDMWSVFFLVPMGRAAGAPRLTAQQCEEAFERLWQQSRVRSFLIKTTEAPHYRRFVRQRRTSLPDHEVGKRPAFSSFNVNDGKGVMFISHTGVILPSGFLPFGCGRFPKDHVVRVYQNSPIFQALRDVKQLKGKCALCEFRHVCGGSRARAFAVTGDLFAEEPDCAYWPDAAKGERTGTCARA